MLDISTGNERKSSKIFPVEISGDRPKNLKSGMAKKPELEIPEIFLGDWLAQFEIGPSKAARIAGCSQGYISNIAAGRKANVNALYLLRLSRYMGIAINDFYRPLPTNSQIESMRQLSPQAQAALLSRKRAKG